jgi:hypothetical protein
MDSETSANDRPTAVPLLGYLNFSDGRPDPKFQKGLDLAFRALDTASSENPANEVASWLLEEADKLQASGAPAFSDLSQARTVIELAFRKFPKIYRRNCEDLLQHHPDRQLFTSLFMSRICETILAQHGPWDEEERIFTGALSQFNDFIGHRPIALLETRQQTEYYPKEKIRPVPIYLRGVGSGYGPYQAIVDEAIRILENTPDELCHEAWFRISRLDELCLDTRAYDHNHPANRRPNYLFGEWDPHQIDNKGFYRRFVVRQTVLDSLVRSTQSTADTGEAHTLLEAGAVLAGTILMASGMSGEGPNTHDSDSKLSTLVPKIARYRDNFYRTLLDSLSGIQANRLRSEAQRLRQPFGGIRQRLNLELARQRAAQLQERKLALIFAELGYPQASRDHAALLPAASVRFMCEIRLRQTQIELLISQEELRKSADVLTDVEELIRRGIDCGALSDPWNCLGFQGLFPLFVAREDSVRDTRHEELIDLLSRQFDLYARTLAAVARTNDRKTQERLRRGVEELAAWWDKFATYEVSDLPRLKGSERSDAATHVSSALARWQQEFGETRSEGDSSNAELRFWREQREGFTSPAAFAQVVDALLFQHEWHAAMALLMAWLSEADTIRLREGETSFHDLALRWMRGVVQSSLELRRRTELICRFLQLLEANGEDWWHQPPEDLLKEDFGKEYIEAEDPYESAYEAMIFRDSTDDGEEGSVLSDEPKDRYELEEVSEHLEERLAFRDCISMLWQIISQAELDRKNTTLGEFSKDWHETARNWLESLEKFVLHLHEMVVPAPVGGVEERVEFDRRRSIRDRLLELGLNSCQELGKAVRSLHALRADLLGENIDVPDVVIRQAIRIEQALRRKEQQNVLATLPSLAEALGSQPLLFVPVSEGGHPTPILRARTNFAILEMLLDRLARFGLIRECFHLIRLARSMEQNGPLEGRKVSEFDRLFRTALVSVVEALLETAEQWESQNKSDLQPFSEMLFKVANSFLQLWIEHSHTLRLSALEGIGSGDDWEYFRDFLKKYGRGIFTASFMTLGNLRGILHQRVDRWLDSFETTDEAAIPQPLYQDLESAQLDRRRTTHYLETAILAIVENYPEFQDYNTTTTQSDYGENLHILMDFLRVKMHYDRAAWRMRPLAWAHEVLCRRGHFDIADRWKASIEKLRTRQLSEELLHDLEVLETDHAVRLRSIRDHVEERFLTPLLLDRLCAKVEPSAKAARAGEDETNPAFAELLEQLQPLSENPSGVGVDVPSWLRKFESEVHSVRERLDRKEMVRPFTLRDITLPELQRQVDDWDKPMLRGT